MSKKIYLAGKITGDPNYKEKFDSAATELRNAGYIVWNPAELSKGFEYATYRDIGFYALHACDIICLLPGALESSGAMEELKFAYGEGKKVMIFEMWIKEQESESDRERRVREAKGFWYVGCDFDACYFPYDYVASGLDWFPTREGTNCFPTKEACEATIPFIKKALLKDWRSPSRDEMSMIPTKELTLELSRREGVEEYGQFGPGEKYKIKGKGHAIVLVVKD